MYICLRADADWLNWGDFIRLQRIKTTKFVSKLNVMERERTQTCTHSLRGFCWNARVRTHNILRIQVMNICSIHVHIVSNVASLSPAKQFSLLLLHCRVIYFSVRFGIQLQILFWFSTMLLCIARGVAQASNRTNEWTDWLPGWLGSVCLNDFYYIRLANKYNAVNLLVNCAIVSHSFDSFFCARFVSFLLFDSKMRFCNAVDCYDDVAVDR